MNEEFKTNEKYYPLSANKEGVIKNIKTGNIRAFCLGSHGYPVVSTANLGTILSHRIVAEIWLPNPENLREVNHIDLDKTNNNISNLEWVSSKDNSKHASVNGRMSHLNRVRGEDNNMSLHSDEMVHLICKDLEEGLRNVDLAKKYKIPASYMKSLKKGVVRKEISSQYNLTKTEKRSVSESTVRWICEKVVEGLTRKEIVSLATNPKVTETLIKNIRSKGSYSTISDEYF